MRRTAAVLAVLAGLCVACGDDDTDAAPTTTTTTTTTTVATTTVPPASTAATSTTRAPITGEQPLATIPPLEDRRADTARALAHEFPDWPTESVMAVIDAAGPTVCAAVDRGVDFDDIAVEVLGALDEVRRYDDGEALIAAMLSSTVLVYCPEYEVALLAWTLRQ